MFCGQLRTRYSRGQWRLSYPLGAWAQFLARWLLIKVFAPQNQPPNALLRVARNGAQQGTAHRHRSIGIAKRWFWCDRVTPARSVAWDGRPVRLSGLPPKHFLLTKLQASSAWSKAARFSRISR